MPSTHHRRWRLRAPLGLILTGFGLCLVAEAAFLKYGGAPALQWVLAGTAALVVFNSGLSVFGSAVIARVMDLNDKQQHVN